MFKQLLKWKTVPFQVQIQINTEPFMKVWAYLLRKLYLFLKSRLVRIQK